MERNLKQSPAQYRINWIETEGKVKDEIDKALQTGKSNK
ncbi:hypothetical protein HNR65_002391 [Desulfosalsimonas propionicica]|uniref:Uncharacterized protein n=1 Tax=Desulfosalsimonas propionicica TaxID=332175 RepID=A0A7W0CAG0_9BACT|nr:hypothetical protein [Desulfosalsimonas propionicica]